MSDSQRTGYFKNLKFRERGMQANSWLLVTQARLRNKRFTCNALAGRSTYNICVNADLSVSCNCDDTSGDGRMGSLKDSTFGEVFGGEIANDFRKRLARGELPVSKCARCPELAMVDTAQAQQDVQHFAIPAGVMVENNANCNLSCVGCGRAQRPLQSLKMRIEEVREVARQLAALNVRRIHYFSLGEPFMSRNILEEMQAIRQEMPKTEVFTSTNGVLLDNDDKRRAALLMDRVTFSVDGCDQETLTRYQVGSDFNAAYQNICDLVAFRDRNGPSAARIVWKYVVFKWNDRKEHVEKTLELARKANVDELEFIFTLNPYWAISPRFLTAAYWRKVAPLKDKRRVMTLRPAS